MIHAPSREVRGHSPEELALRAWMNQGPRLLVRAFEKRLRCALASRFQIESRERSFVFFPALRALYPTGLVFAQIAVCLPSLGYQRTFRRLDSFSHEALGATPTPPPPPPQLQTPDWGTCSSHPSWTKGLWIHREGGGLSPQTSPCGSTPPGKATPRILSSPSRVGTSQSKLPDCTH